jgi:hypothetical protein
MDGFGHNKLARGKSVIWLTPPIILQKLGVFDLDPCAAPNPRPWATANHHFDGSNYDGLKEPWFGRVWLNPPYDQKSMTAFMRKMSQHRSGIAFLFARTETAVWQRYVWSFADSILFLEGRVQFYRPDGSKAWSAGAPSALIAYSAFDTAVLRVSGLRGALVRAY